MDGKAKLAGIRYNLNGLIASRDMAYVDAILPLLMDLEDNYDIVPKEKSVAAVAREHWTASPTNLVDVAEAKG